MFKYQKEIQEAINYIKTCPTTFSKWDIEDYLKKNGLKLPMVEIDKIISEFLDLNRLQHWDLNEYKYMRSKTNV